MHPSPPSLSQTHAFMTVFTILLFFLLLRVIASIIPRQWLSPGTALTQILLNRRRNCICIFLFVAPLLLRPRIIPAVFRFLQPFHLPPPPTLTTKRIIYFSLPRCSWCFQGNFSSHGRFSEFDSVPTRLVSIWSRTDIKRFFEDCLRFTGCSLVCETCFSWRKSFCFFFFFFYFFFFFFLVLNLYSVDWFLLFERIDVVEIIVCRLVKLIGLVFLLAFFLQCTRERFLPMLK